MDYNSPLRRTTGAPADGGDALLRELLSNLKSSDLKQLLPETYGKVDDKLPSRRPSSGGFRYSCKEILPPQHKTCFRNNRIKTKVIQDDVSKFLPPGFKAPVEEQALSINKIFPSVNPTEAVAKDFKTSKVSNFFAFNRFLSFHQVKSESLPHSLLPTDYPESLLSIKQEEVDPALLPPGYKIKQEEIDPSLLPPGFKVKQEEIDASLLPPGYKIKEEKIDDSLLPPGFKVKQEEIDPALLPPGFKVKQEEVDPALLPPGYDLKSVKIEPAPLDPSLLPKGYNPDAIKVKTPPASLLPKGFDPNAAPPTPPPSTRPTPKQIKLSFPG